AREAAAWRTRVGKAGADVGTVPGLSQGAADLSGLVEPLRAARRLDALATWCDQATHPAPEDRPPPPEGGPSADPLDALLRELVDEGVPADQPLLARMVELPRRIEADGGRPPPAPPRLAAPVDHPADLLPSHPTPGAHALRA